MKFRFEWRPGWAASNLERLSPALRQKRHTRIERDVRRALTKAGVRTKQGKNPVRLNVMVDLTKRGNRKVNTGDLVGIVEPMVKAMPYNVKAISFSPVQYARPGWHGTQEELKRHTAKSRKIARRYRRMGQKKIADGLLRSLFYGPSVDVSVVVGDADIRGGVDGGEPSMYFTGKKVKDFPSLRDTAWASVMVEGRGSLAELAYDAKFFVDRMIVGKKIPNWGRVIHVVVRNSPKSQITLRDWGRSNL